MSLSCTPVNCPCPNRFAGTWRQYSKKAIPQLAKITIQSGLCLNFKWPYQANVIKMFDRVNKTIVLMINYPFFSVVSNYAFIILSQEGSVTLKKEGIKL